MKKLLMGSIALCLFSLSIAIFNLSCKKDAQAQTSTPITQAGLVLYATQLGGIGVENYDGSNQVALNIVLPAGNVIWFSAPPAISPDHKTIFFEVYNQAANNYSGYTCNLDGSNAHKIDNSGVHVPF